VRISFKFRVTALSNLHRWRDPPISDEDAFASLKAGMDSLPPGAKMFLNSGAYTNIYRRHLAHIPRTGEFYGINPPSANLELLARFFERYPGYADKAFLSVKVRIADSWRVHLS
jgi:pyridoxine 4-dehydrogenase